MSALEKHIVGENGISYTLGADEIYYPDLVLPEMPEYEIGRYRMLRKRYLMEYRECFFYELLTSCKLMEHLHEIDVACIERMELFVEQMEEREEITEQLKAENMIEWVRKMNQIRKTAEEILLNDLVYH